MHFSLHRLSISADEQFGQYRDGSAVVFSADAWVGIGIELLALECSLMLALF